MKINYAMLADSAIATDGKFYIHGGDLTRVTPPTLPWSQTLALALKLDPESDELSGTEHKIQAVLLDPDGKITNTFSGGFLVRDAPPDAETGQPEWILCAFTMGAVVFERSGRHTFRIYVDSDEDLSVVLPVTVAEPATPGLTPTARNLT